MSGAQINFLEEIIVDNFAGGGGASTGIELATGRPVTIAINHDPDAILMHKTNHPFTEHYQASVWDVDPAGGSVAIWPMDPEKMEPSGPAEVYGDWDAAAYLRRVVELIHPNRQINIPNLEAMIRAAAKDGVDICTYCPDYNCRGCIVNEWKEDPDDE